MSCMCAEECFIFLCDLQSGFETVANSPETIATAQRMVAAAGLLGVPVIATEHEDYGPIIPEVKGDREFHVFQKTTLTMLTPEVEAFMLKEPHRQSVVLLGIKAHVCVLQTALHLTRLGVKVHVLADGVSSANETSRCVRDYQCGVRPFSTSC